MKSRLSRMAPTILRISAPDEGILCYMSNVTIKDAQVELTGEMGKNCK